MSIESFVFLRDDRLPTVEQWQAALDEAGTGIVLDDVGDLRGHTGYLPATHRGYPSGFEWFYGSLEESFGGEPPDGLGDRKHAANFVSHSDLRELICGMVAGAVLARLTGGLVLDEDSGQVTGGDAAFEAARSAEAQSQKQLERRRS